MFPQNVILPGRVKWGGGGDLMRSILGTGHQVLRPARGYGEQGTCRLYKWEHGNMSNLVNLRICKERGIRSNNSIETFK